MIRPEEALPGRAEPIAVAEVHPVLGTPLVGPWPDSHEVIYFAMGCFWGADRIMWQIPGVHSTACGYMGGWTPNPTYEETCTSQTGHTEIVMVVFDPNVAAIETLLAAFWENHDPTTANRQGNDIGTQYRSAVFTTTPQQLAAVEASRAKYQSSLSASSFGAITTQICDASSAGDGTFYYAEDYHQGYLHKYPAGYCNHGFCQVAYATS